MCGAGNGAEGVVGVCVGAPGGAVTSALPPLTTVPASVELPSVDTQVLPVAAQRPTQGVEVDEVDSPSRGISVFEIPVPGAAAANANGPSSVVIMIEDEGKK